MVLGIVFLFLVFLVTRYLILRYNGSSTSVNIAGFAILASFVVGSIARTFSLPINSPNTTPAAITPAPSIAPAPAAVVTESPDAPKPRDVSIACRTAPRSPTPGGVGAFDALATNDGPPVQVTKQGSLEKIRAYAAFGWAADKSKQSPASAACVLVDGRVDFKAATTYGLFRPDVAAAYNAPALAQSGFKIVLARGQLAAGHHILTIAVKSADGTFAVAPGEWNVTVR